VFYGCFDYDFDVFKRRCRRNIAARHQDKAAAFPGIRDTLFASADDVLRPSIFDYINWIYVSRKGGFFSEYFPCLFYTYLVIN
jgi:hypothetical protein